MIFRHVEFDTVDIETALISIDNRDIIDSLDTDTVQLQDMSMSSKA